MSNYYLRRDVHYCQIDDGVVFLDLDLGTYLGLGLAEAAALQSIVRGWPRHPREPEQPTQKTSTDTAAIAEALVQKRLLTSDVSKARDAAPEATECQAEVEITDPTSAIPRIHVRDLANLLLAVTLAAFKLRWLSFRRVVRGVEQRKRRSLGATHANEEQRLRDLVRIFRRLRTLIYTNKNQCLYDSLVLLEFLHRYGLHPTWVLGVHTRPFAAHSWLQYRTLVLNESPDLTREYTPILAI